MTTILGISAYYHDSAAALVIDGSIVAAAQEERFTRIKHDHAFPQNAIDYCLAEAGIDAEQIDYVGFYDRPLLKFERLLETYLAFAPAGYPSFRQAMPLWLRQKLHLPRLIRKGLGGRYKKRIVFTQHHESHAASAFFPSPFSEAAILTLDGVGEWATTSIGVGRDNRVELQKELHFPTPSACFTPHSPTTADSRSIPANTSSWGSRHTGSRSMPKRSSTTCSILRRTAPSGSTSITLTIARADHDPSPVSLPVRGPPRTRESALPQREMDIAASIQDVTEEIMLRIARNIHRETGMRNLCLAGGVALNCVGNGRIVREGPFEQIWIQPAAGDAGGALGTALFIWHQLLENARTPQPHDSQTGTLLGPHFQAAEIQEFLDQAGAHYQAFEQEEDLIEAVSDTLAQEQVVGWMQGRMEFGPRALGSRSILGDPRSEKMQSTMNLRIKFRESFRPFAPSVLQERCAEYFDLGPTAESPYMLLVGPVQESKRTPPSEDGHLQGLDKLKALRSEIPAVTHVDYSARVQTVDPVRHGRYYRLIQRFEQKTGCPLLINTSFNVRGEPIVCTPQDAYRCFMATNMDALVIENFLLRKQDQPNAVDHQRDDYLAQFELD